MDTCEGRGLGMMVEYTIDCNRSCKMSCYNGMTNDNSFSELYRCDM